MKIYNSHEYINYMAGKIQPAMRYDGSEPFTDWQKKARNKLEELLGLPFAKCDDMFRITDKVESDGYTRIDFEFQSEEGYFVPCNLLIPAGIKEALPGVICLQGHSTGKHITIGVPKFYGDEQPLVSVCGILCAQ